MDEQWGGGEGWVRDRGGNLHRSLDREAHGLIEHPGLSYTEGESATTIEVTSLGLEISSGQHAVSIVPMASADPTQGDGLSLQMGSLVLGDDGKAWIKGGPDANDWKRLDPDAAVSVVIDGGGSTLTTGIKGDVEVPYKCRVAAVRMLADQTGSIVVDIWRAPFSEFPPTVDDSITASAKPTISNDTKSQDIALTGWERDLDAGDVLRFNIDSVTAIQRVSLVLYLERR